MMIMESRGVKVEIVTVINFQLIKYLLSTYYTTGLYTRILEKDTISFNLKDRKRSFIHKASVIGR